MATEAVMPLQVRASRHLSTSLSVAVVTKKIHEDEARAISMAVAQLENGNLVMLAPDQLERALQVSWERQIGFRESLSIQEDESRKAYENAYAEGIRFSLARVGGWRFALSDHFTKCIQKIDKKLQGRILEAITKIGDAPLTTVGDTVKPLSGDLKGLWRYRVGDYRLVYDPNPDEELITLVSFEARGDIY